jgi:hypothetical protein
VRSVGSGLDAALTLAPVLTRPADVLDPVRRAAAGLTSQAWRTAPDDRAAAAEEFATRTAGLATAVRVLEGSTVNVLAEQAALPLTVVNELDQAVDVLLALQPRSPRLRVPDPVPVTLAPGGRQSLTVPVEALANGNVEVLVRLLTPGGEPLGPVVPLQVRVRADWGSWATTVAGGVAVLLLVVGVLRTVRRARRGAGTGPDTLAGAAPQPAGGRR